MQALSRSRVKQVLFYAIGLLDVDQLRPLQMAIDLLIGQGFDGAGNMAEPYNRVHIRLKEMCSSKPVFVLC
jgi:hypothetical protein